MKMQQVKELKIECWDVAGDEEYQCPSFVDKPPDADDDTAHAGTSRGSYGGAAGTYAHGSGGGAA